MSAAKEYPVNGLPGYFVKPCPRFNCYYTILRGVVRSFSWNDDTHRHDIPILADASGWAQDSRATFKGAIAAAHAHAERMKSYLASL